jgi:hypothetical protein
MRKMIEKKVLKEIKKRLKKGENLYYNRFSENQMILTNDWDTIRQFNCIADFPRWECYTKYRVEDLDFESLDRIIKGEEEREFRLYIELL